MLLFMGSRREGLAYGCPRSTADREGVAGLDAGKPTARIWGFSACSSPRESNSVPSCGVGGVDDSQVWRIACVRV